MGQLAFAAVGAVVSTYVGAGPAIGWAIGSAIGGVVFAPDGAQTTGPRLDDLKSNVSTYGQPIPRAYGQIGFMGSLIWMDDMQEQENVEEQGKGGDPASATTFSYSCSFAMIICRGENAEIEGSVAVKTINRIWINEKCYYDVRDEANVEAMVASMNFAKYFKFYPGNQTQMPDPTMEAILGVGNVPAYRGRSYVVFTDLPLGWFQNQPPGALRITFEVVMEGTPQTGLRLLKKTNGTPGSGGLNLIMPVTEGVVRVFDGTSTVWVNDVNGNGLSVDTPTDEEAEWPETGDGSYIDQTFAVTRLYDGNSVRAYKAPGVTANNAIDSMVQRLYAEVGLGQISALPLFPVQTDFITNVIPCADQRHIFVCTSDGIGPTYQNYHLLEWDSEEVDWVLVRSASITSNALTASIGPSSQNLAFYASMAESNLRWVWSMTAAGGAQFTLQYIEDDFTMTLVDVLTVDSGLYSFQQAKMWVDDGLCYAFGSTWFYVVTRNDGAAINGQTLEQVHTAECLLGGLESSQIEASALAPIIVDGMFVRRLGAPRGVLQALQPAYFYDTYEGQGQLKAKLRGGASVVTIDEDELGASTGGVAEEDLINPERADEDSLPGQAIVTYIDRASDYQVAAQHDRRSAVETDQPVNLEMPLVFSPDDARQIASVWLYNQWISRTKRTVKLSRKYSYLEPTDIITLRTSIADFLVRITAIKTNEGVLELECVDEDAAVYTQNAEGSNIDQGSTVSLVAPTKIVLLDIPMLREVDNDPGFYLAAAGYGNTWPGALIMRSSDGVSYGTVASITTPAIMGNVALTLPDFTGPIGYDYQNSITVTLFNQATLQSCTDAELLAGANAFALGSSTNGWEIGKFKTATLISGNTWKLTQLIRGRRGTEAKMANHQTNETFVLLEASKLRRLGIDDPAIGEVNYFKGVSIGQIVTNAATVSFTNTAASLKPYSGVDPRATGFGGDVTITWTRRGRLYNGWRDGVELPLGEATESYSIDIYDGATLKRTLTSSTPSVVYSSANQTTDFGAPVSTGDADAHIYQLSAIVGRGFPLIFNIA